MLGALGALGADRKTSELHKRGVQALLWGASDDPARLAATPGGPPVLFHWGNRDLLDKPGLSMCGSRHVTPVGLRAAQICAGKVAKRGMVVPGHLPRRRR